MADSNLILDSKRMADSSPTAHSLVTAPRREHPRPEHPRRAMAQAPRRLPPMARLKLAICRLQPSRLRVV